MSVFTPLDDTRIRSFLAHYPVGRLLHWQGIEGGSENSNFFIDCDSGCYVLTLIERGSREHLDFMIRLLDCLHAAGLPVPYAVRSTQGQALGVLEQRPAMLQPRLTGGHPEQLEPAHCAALGQLLARLHLAAAALPQPLPNPRGLQWTQEQAGALLNGPWAEEAGLHDLLFELQAEAGAVATLPACVIHADLFRDNVLFAGQQLTGVIDFYNAGRDARLYDLAICLNDWCFDATGEQLQPALAAALLQAYAVTSGGFDAEEQRLWPTLLRLAALRFRVSRHLYRAAHHGQPGVLVKDPARMAHILGWHQHHTAPSLPGATD